MQEPASWVPVNVCDHEIDNPYHIGDLKIAAANCAGSCPTTTYPDNAQVCHACPVVGCATCSRTGCEDCLIFHMHASGNCIFIFDGIFGAIALFSLCLLLFGLLRFCCLALLTPTNRSVLKEALAHRRRAKVHDYSLPGNPFYGYDDTNVRRQTISGIGPCLYFRFVGFLVTFSFILSAAIVAWYFVPQLVPESQLNFTTLVCSAVLYVICLLVVIRWMWTQDRVVRSDVEEEPHLRNYALVAEGFPKSARSPHEVKAFFESILGFEMEGVSIAYDHVEESEFVDDRVSRAIEKADTHLGVYPAELSGLEGHIGDSQDGHVLDCLMCSGYAFIVFSREEDREFCMRRFAEIDRQVKQGLHQTVDADSDSDDESQALLKTGPGRGRAPRPGTGGATGPSRAVLFRGKFPIRVGPAPEPCGILWNNFAVRRGAKLVRVAVTLLGALLLVVVFGAVMFAPAVLYEMSYINIRKPTQTQFGLAILEQGVVCSSIAVGNRFLIFALRRASELSGFLQKVNEDSVFVICAYCAILLNCTSPLIIASIVASTERTTVTRGLTCSFMFQVLWMSMFVTEVANVAVPLWRYWSAYFWIRQSKYVSVREAEPYITTAEFPLATRYADLLNLLTLDCCMVAVDNTALYTIAAQCLMLLYCIYVYFIDKYWFLRVNRNTYYTSPKLDGVIHYLFVFPMSILSLTCIFIIEAVPYVNVIIFLANAVIFLILVRICQKCNEPHRELSDIPYVEVASLMPYNYFNMNHVHVLRVLHFPSIVVPPIYPFLPGKEYLQGGQFADYDDSVRLRETLMLLAKSPLKGVDDFGNPQDYG